MNTRQLTDAEADLGYRGSGTYAVALDSGGAIVALRQIDHECRLPDDIDPDQAIGRAARAFAQEHPGLMVRIGVGSCYELAGLVGPAWLAG